MEVAGRLRTCGMVNVYFYTTLILIYLCSNFWGNVRNRPFTSGIMRNVGAKEGGREGGKIER